nr:hypothetical protein BaRGS_028285 [Batillaria attramentaria]
MLPPLLIIQPCNPHLLRRSSQATDSNDYHNNIDDIINNVHNITSDITTITSTINNITSNINNITSNICIRCPTIRIDNYINIIFNNLYNNPNATCR